ncbi:hypothetical protein LTR86_008028 [Recurvomyces mirabilis]|nr:hypothetical protein LTR86_008028 [Recurvomyces mirabilis]
MTGSTNLTYIHSPEEHDQVVAKADAGTPTVIFLRNDVTPACKAFTPKYEAIVEKYAHSGIQFCIMEFTNATSMMFKFAPNQLPVIPLMVGGQWCRTVTAANMKDFEPLLQELLEIAAQKK